MSMVYRCDSCGSERPYLSDSWSVITFGDPTTIPPVHHCLDCRSDKIEYRAAQRAQGSLS